MPTNERVDDLLDVWEELLAKDPAAAVGDFLREHGCDLDDESLALFRRKAAALARMDERLNAVQDTNNGQTDTSDPERTAGLAQDPEPGLEPIEGYELVERLGQGGFGEVWKATDSQGFSVAIKFVNLSGEIGETELRSLNVIKEVRHPHLLSIFRVVRRDDVLVIAMELADRSLLDRFEEAKKEGYEGIPRNELLEYMAEAAKGIDFLNDPGSSGRPRIQHRDIKPANLLLSGNSVKIADYSLVQALTFNVTESIGSTPAYAAPEFFDGNTTSRSDQYSLAITYCHLRGGRVPFQGNLVDVMEAHRNREPDLSMLLPEERPAVARALSKKSKDRWPTCAAFVEALKSSAVAPISESPAGFTGLLRTVNELPTKTKAVAGAVAASLVVLVLLFALVGGDGGNEDTAKPGPGQPAGPAAVTDDAERPLTVAVLDFANHSQDPKLDGYRLGFRDMLTTDLAKLSSIKVLERARLEALLQEHDLAKTDFIAPESAVRLRKGLSAHAMLNGSYLISGDDIRVDVRLVSVETGEVIQADAVEGKKSDMFGLQKSLAAKVLAGLDVQPTDAEQAALNEPQTKDFDAFRLYSEARLAQLQGNRDDAVQRFQEALKVDPSFSLAARELDRIEAEALFRLSQSQEDKAAAAGEIGQRLRDHWNKHQQIVERERRDAEYFASVIVLAAYAGLYGDPDQERQLLLTYWRRFTESVPSAQATLIGEEIRAIVGKEGEFLQKNIDSGDYGIKLFSFGGSEKTVNQKYLKPELRGEFSWPKWSVIWPFNDDARTAFGQIEKAPIPDAAASWKASFERHLPSQPHDYLGKILDYGDALTDQIKNPSRFTETLQTYLSVVSYYGGMADKPKPLADEIDDLQGMTIRLLDRVVVDQVDNALLADAITVLELASKTEADPEKRELANRLLVRFVRQARINEGLPSDVGSDDSGSAQIYEMKLDGSPIVLVQYIGDITDIDISKMAVEKDVKESLGDLMRSLPSNVRFNCCWAGHIDEDAEKTLFDEPQAADVAAKQKGLAWLGM